MDVENLLCYLAFVLFLLLLVRGNERDFNCPDECGLYAEKDKIGPRLHEGCRVMPQSKSISSSEKESCINTFALEKKRKRKWKRRRGWCPRLAGGIPTQYAMPWMVFIRVNGEGCGGTLINSQFILTAASCFCSGQMICTRNIGDIGHLPIKIQDDYDEIAKKVNIYMGMTHHGGNGLDPMDPMKQTTKAKELQKHIQNYSGKNIFVHPLLSTSKEFSFTPDVALINLNIKVKSFNEHIRPICLANKQLEERPICPDMSREKQEDKDCRKEIIFGGCGTMAGWGQNRGQRLNGDSNCKTDLSNLGPDKHVHCSPYWTLNGQDMVNCSNEEIPIEDLTETCYLLARELEFQKALGKKLNLKPRNATYMMKDITDLSIAVDSPIEVYLSGKGSKNEIIERKNVFYCGMTKFSQKMMDKKNGWCATKLDREDKIESWGFCNSACEDTQSGFSFSNVNILNNEECEELSKHTEHYELKKDNTHIEDYYYYIEDSRHEKDSEYKEDSKKIRWHKRYELCAGTKHDIPKASLSFKMVKKAHGEREEEEEKVKKLGVDTEFQPTDYKYELNQERSESKVMKTLDDYPYDWVLDGAESCKGDIGGPLWRNIKDKGKVRAAQIGVFSRGSCASLNTPAVFGSVKMSFDWIKEVVEDEMPGRGYCPKRQNVTTTTTTEGGWEWDRGK